MKSQEGEESKLAEAEQRNQEAEEQQLPEGKLIGVYFQTIDSKGRIVIPIKFRKILAFQQVIAVAISGECVRLYPAKEWEKVEQRLAELPLMDAEASILKLLLGASADTCRLDMAWRCAIPPQLRKVAGLGEQVAIIGTLSYVEIRSRESYDKIMKEYGKSDVFWELCKRWNI